MKVFKIIDDMKRVLLVVELILFCVPMFSQGIKYIKLTEERWEFMTEEEVYRQKNERTFSMMFQVYNDIEEIIPENKLRYYMILTFSNNGSPQIPERGKLLIKTGKDEVISSVNEEGEQILSYDSATGYSSFLLCKDYVSNKYFSYYRIRGKYELMREDLDKILTDGVVKMRVETSGESIDVEFPLEEVIRVEKEKQKTNRFAKSVENMLRLVPHVFDHAKEL